MLFLIAHDVLSLPSEDAGIQKGIVRLHNGNIGSRGSGRFYRWQPVVVENPNSKRTIVRFVMGSSPSHPIKAENSIQLDYDAKLELDWTSSDLLNVYPASQLTLYLWYWRHPDPGYRIAMRLGIISVVLGLLGFVQGFLGLFF